MFKFLLLISLSLISLSSLAKARFYILPEENFSIQSQLNSIFLKEGLNSKEIQRKVLKLNRLNEAQLSKLEQLKKIRIPSPLKQVSCNFSRSQSGIVIFKRPIRTNIERIRAITNPENSCNHYKVFQNYIIRKNNTPLSSIIYSIFLSPLWKKNGLMPKIKRINGLTSNKEFETRNNFFIPSISQAKGCNFYRLPNGKVMPLKLILKTSEKKDFAIAFKCAGPRPIDSKTAQEDKPLEKEQPSKPEPIKIKPKPHFIEIAALTNIKFGESKVSDVEVDIISAYGLILNYHYQMTPNKLFNFNTQFEYYTEVKNRELANNFTWKKNINFEYLYTKKLDYGITMGFFEQWFFENIEVDEFVFTNSLHPYLGVTLHKGFGSFKMNLEFGAFPSTDLLNREMVQSGYFAQSSLHFSAWNYQLFVGLNFDYTEYERSSTRNTALIGGLHFNF